RWRKNCHGVQAYGLEHLLVMRPQLRIIIPRVGDATLWGKALRATARRRYNADGCFYYDPELTHGAKKPREVRIIPVDTAVQSVSIDQADPRNVFPKAAELA